MPGLTGVIITVVHLAGRPEFEPTNIFELGAFLKPRLVWHSPSQRSMMRIHLQIKRKQIKQTNLFQVLEDDLDRGVTKHN